MTPELHAAILAHVQSEHPRESCGLLVWDGKTHATYRPCRNTSTEADRFSIDPRDWADAEDAGVVLGVVHSHPDGDLTPSEWDLHSCRESGLPWWIFSGSDWIRIPGRYPLTGRPYAWGVSDCLTVVRDWYSAHGRAFPDFLRTERYEDHLTRCGFELVHAPDNGDLLLFPRNHAGVYLGQGSFLHHREGQLSRVETLSGYWQAKMKVARCGR